MSSDHDYSAAKLFDVKGMVVMITGGGSGLGLAMARALAQNGAQRIYILGRREHMLTNAASTHPDSIIPVVGDVTSKDSLMAAAEKVKKESGYLDLLIANSGVLGPRSGDWMPKDRTPGLEEWSKIMWDNMSMEEFTQIQHVNITGAYYTVLAFLPLLGAGNARRQPVKGLVGALQQKSQVIITTSIAGFSRVPAAGFHYSTSKAAVTHLIKNFATKLSEFEIRVNGIAPGMFPSEMNSSGGEKKKEGDMPADAIPMKRFGTEEEMAGVCLFLASPAGGYMDGDIVVVDGGRISKCPATY